MTLPEGLLVRSVVAEQDIEAALTVVSTCELAGVGWTDATRDSVTAQLVGPDALALAHLIAFDGDEPVGLLAAEIDRHGREIFLDAFAIGEHAVALQRELLTRGIATAMQVTALDPVKAAAQVDNPYELSPDVWQVVSAAYEQDEEYRNVLTSLGFRPIRRFWRMLQDLSTTASERPEPPPGVALRVVDGEDDRRLMHALFCESFAEHFGSSNDRPFEEWMASVEALPGTDPDRWWIAILDGRPVGICLLDDSKAEFGEGYVRTLGVIPSARGRGVATWLLACAAADS
ncbi:MAG: GNAT family N-acetyltransferase, partial [bacterium]|nr:GNAT family N-acetyltransferase [bacterium]